MACQSKLRWDDLHVTRAVIDVVRASRDATYVGLSIATALLASISYQVPEKGRLYVGKTHSRDASVVDIERHIVME